MSRAPRFSPLASQRQGLMEPHELARTAPGPRRARVGGTVDDARRGPRPAGPRGLFAAPGLRNLARDRLSGAAFPRNAGRGGRRAWDTTYEAFERSVRPWTCARMHEKVAVLDGRVLWHGSLKIRKHATHRERGSMPAAQPPSRRASPPRRGRPRTFTTVAAPRGKRAGCAHRSGQAKRSCKKRVTLTIPTFENDLRTRTWWTCGRPPAWAAPLRPQPPLRE